VVKKPLGKIVAGGMLRQGTPIIDRVNEWGLYVKREDLSCPKPGPPFSKTRGVYRHVLSRPETVIGVLDTYHSQAGHAVARACQVLGKRCLNFYPDFKYEPGPRAPQHRAAELGAELVSLPAGRSSILWHAARKKTEAVGGYMMPNALKLPESIEETAKEVPRGERFDYVLVPASSATIAAGVLRGFAETVSCRSFVVHLGYDRSEAELLRYVAEASGVDLGTIDVRLVNEGYGYKDTARPGPTPDWPCNPYYDLKAFRWWATVGRTEYPRSARVLFWNVG
jgi:Pyridoxal-phosphate dependent enzyme